MPCLRQPCKPLPGESVAADLISNQQFQEMFSQLGDKLQDIFKDLRGHGTISEANITDALREVRMALLEADVDFTVSKKFIARVREKALGEEVLRSITPGQQIVKIFQDELTALLGGDQAPLNLDKPARILMVGLNGAGKTTSSAKLAQLSQETGTLPAAHRVRSSSARRHRAVGHLGPADRCSRLHPASGPERRQGGRPAGARMGRKPRTATFRFSTPPAGRKSTRR